MLDASQDPVMAFCLAKEVAAFYFDRGYLSFFGVHMDTDNLHIHIAVSNISWKDGKIKAAKLYTKPGHDFIDQLVICYKGKRYNASLKNNSLDVMNVLPTTV